MIRLFKNALFTIVLLSAIVLFFGFNPFLKWRIQSVMHAPLEQVVTFEAIRLSPFTGTGDISGMSVYGVGDFKDKKVLYIPRISIAFSPLSLFTSVVQVKHISVHDADISFDGTMTHNNVSTLISKLAMAEQDKTSAPLLPEALNKTFHIAQTEQKGTNIEVAPDILKGHKIQANVPDLIQEKPFGEKDVPLQQVVSFVILDVLSRSPEAITGEFNILKEGLVGLGLLKADEPEPQEKPGFFGRLKNKISSIF